MSTATVKALAAAAVTLSWAADNVPTEKERNRLTMLATELAARAVRAHLADGNSITSMPATTY